MDAIRVLYAEDDPVDCELMLHHLRRSAPYVQMQTVGTGRETLEILREGVFDVILLDYRLPDVEGLQLLRDVVSSAPHVPVVMVTGSGDHEVAVAALKAGAADYLVKRRGYLDRLPVVMREVLDRHHRERHRRTAGLCILYAEHDPVDVDLTLRFLTTHASHLQVEIAGTGAATLHRLESGTYNLLLIDYRMPDLNGLEILQGMRERGIRVPVVMMTGHGDEEIAVQALKLGALDYIVKREGYLTQLPSTIESVIAQWALAEEKETLLRVGERLRESEERFRSVVQSAPDAVIIANGSDEVITWNKSAQAIFGYTPEEVVGAPITVLMPERYRDAHTAGFEQYKLTGEAHAIGKVIEAEGLRKDGREFPLEYSLASWQIGEERFFSAILRDITERKQFQIRLEATVEERTQELQEALRCVEAASRHKSEFLANMSHEFRTPLNSIIGFSDILRDPAFGPLTDKQARFVQNILTSGEHLLSLINDLLDLSRVEAGKIDLRPEPFECQEAVHAALAEIQPQADLKQLELMPQTDEAPSTIIADPVRFKQILLNLLSNAVKFTPEGGRITVTARRVSSVEHGALSVGPQPPTPNPQLPAEFVEIAVADTGIGMKPDDLPRLFQEFTRLDTAIAQRTKGTGLGLALTKRLVELHGGEIAAASGGEGRGSTFTVRLPMTPTDHHALQ